MHRLALLAACLAFAAAGWALGFHPHLLSFSSSTKILSGTTGQASPEAVPERDKLSNKTNWTPQTYDQIHRRLLAGMSTEALWKLLEEDESDPYFSGTELGQELADRLGWQAWDRILAARNVSVVEAALYTLADRDPVRAIAAWKEARAKLSDVRYRIGITLRMLDAAANLSAGQMVDVITVLAPDSGWALRFDYAPSFDFPAALDALGKQQCLPRHQQSYNLLDTWAARSPVDAARWLAQHPEAMNPPGEGYGVGADRTLRAIAALPEDRAGRAEALALLARSLPAEDLAKAWRPAEYIPPHPVYSPAMDAAATAMGQQDAYLPALLAASQWDTELDPSWQKVPPERRANLLDKAEAILGSPPNLAPVELLQHARWRQMVQAAWAKGE